MDVYYSLTLTYPFMLCQQQNIPYFSRMALTVKEGMCVGDFEEKYKLLRH